MIKVCVLLELAVVLSGCAAPATTWKGQVEWPLEGDASVKTVVTPTEAGAALAAAAAIREMVRTNTDPGLFWGCSSPEQGLEVAVFTGPTRGLYYVALGQRFDRCGGPRGRVLDWWYVYAVTPQGEVVAEAPLPSGQPPNGPLPQTQPPSEPAPAPTGPSPGTEPTAPSPGAPSLPPSPPAPPPTPSSPASPSPPPPAPGTPLESSDSGGRTPS